MNMEKQEKRAVKILGGLGVCAIAFSLWAGCAKEIMGPAGPQGGPGKEGPTGNVGQNGATGATGPQGYGAGVVATQLSAGATCLNGGVQLQTFQDLNNNGVEDVGDPMLSLTYVCNGLNGATGTVGATGSNGSNGATGATGSTGNNGTNGSNGSNGSNGTDGATGNNGSNGTDGSNTTFSIVTDAGVNCPNGGFDVTLTDSSHSETEYVCNGVNGTNGLNGNAGTNGTNGSNGGTVSFNLVQAIEPCGANSSPWKEVILGLVGGQLLSSFSDNSSGSNTRFSFIPNGSYVDTDSSGCNFTVAGDGLTTSSISWGAGSNSYSTWSAGGYSWTPAGGWISL